MDLESSILTLSLANSRPLILQGSSVGVAKEESAKRTDEIAREMHTMI